MVHAIFDTIELLWSGQRDDSVEWISETVDRSMRNERIYVCVQVEWVLKALIYHMKHDYVKRASLGRGMGQKHKELDNDWIIALALCLTDLN